MNSKAPIVTLTDQGLDIYTKLSWFKEAKVATANVMVVGCGALGNEVLKNLVLFGFRHITVVDFDRVEPSNLSRSILFSRRDAEARRWKVEVVAERLKAINPDVEVVSICGNVAYDVGLGLLRRMQVIIGCVDNRWARYCINRLAMRAGIPWVDGGIDSLEGTARVFMPGVNCYACNLGPEGLKDLHYQMSCSGIIRHNEMVGRVPTTPIVASVIGAVQVQEAIKLIHREELDAGLFTSLCGKMFYYEGQHLTTRTVAFRAYDDDCPVHDTWHDIRPSAIRSSMTVSEALATLRDELNRQEVSIHLLNDCFVDYIIDRATDERVTMMCAGHLIADKVGEHEQLCTRPLSALYQHELRIVDASFPYSSLKLHELGIPANDVLSVSTPTEEYHIEMNDTK